MGDDPAVVRANRVSVAEALGVTPATVVYMNQVHGREVAVVERPGSADAAPVVDAMVTRRAGLVLAVLTADCAPVLLADPVAGVVGAAHAGRPGMVAGVVPAVVDAMVALGARPHRVVAHLGPAICGGCYEVPEGMRAEVAAVVPRAAAVTRWGTPSVDVPAGVRAQLVDAGVFVPPTSGYRPGEVAEVCTYQSADHFSYRRERTTGRLASYVWWDG